jgi:alpha/beta superfamily hydrolase
MGDADELVPAAETVTLVEALRPAPRLLLLPGVGHFFHGQLNVLKDEVLSWARSPS